MFVVLVRREPYPPGGIAPAKNAPTSELRMMYWLRREIGLVLDQIPMPS
jgi:hypothetical protein